MLEWYVVIKLLMTSVKLWTVMTDLLNSISYFIIKLKCWQLMLISSILNLQSKWSYAIITDLYTRNNLMLLIPLESFKINLFWIYKTCNIFEILQNNDFIKSSIVKIKLSTIKK